MSDDIDKKGCPLPMSLREAMSRRMKLAWKEEAKAEAEGRPFTSRDLGEAMRAAAPIIRCEAEERQKAWDACQRAKETVKPKKEVRATEEPKKTKPIEEQSKLTVAEQPKS
jgi:hypothetical protein